MLAGTETMGPFASEPSCRPAPTPVRGPPGAPGRSVWHPSSRTRTGGWRLPLGRAPVRGPLVRGAPAAGAGAGASGRTPTCLQLPPVRGAAGGCGLAQCVAAGVRTPPVREGRPAPPSTRGTAHCARRHAPASSTGRTITKNGGQAPARWSALQASVLRAPAGGARPSGAAARSPTKRFHLAFEARGRHRVSRESQHAAPAC